MDDRAESFGGVDWAWHEHAACVVGAGGEVLDRFSAEHTAKGLEGPARRLAAAGVRRVAIERPDGPVVDALMEAGLDVVVVSSRAVKGLRSRYGAAGNKADASDAYVLADCLRTDGHRWQRMRGSEWAAERYRRLRADGKRHPHAERVLARAWLHVIWRCWQDGVPYDPARHGASQRLIAGTA